MPIVKQPNHRPSLIEYTAQIIREALSAREWIEQMPGERELSQQLHVSRPTLRAALALLERDGLLLRQPGRRRGIVKPARLPVRKSPKVIGLLAPGPFQEIVPSAHLWLNSLQSHLRDKGYDIQIHSSRTCYSQSPERELAAFTRRVPALVWVLFLGTERMQRWFMESGLLCVTSGTPYSGVELPSVDLDHRATCRHAAAQFLGRGHRCIAFMRQGPASAGDIESEVGFLEAFRANPGGVPIVAEHDGSPSGIRSQLKTLLRRTQKPTGFLVARAMPTLTVASELIRRGYRLPHDAAVIGRDNDHFLDFFSPGIARYQVDSQLQAQRLARLVLQVARREVPRNPKVRLMPKFLPGESFV